MTKLMGVFLGLVLCVGLAGCASSPDGDSSQPGGAKVAAATCANKADADRLTCEQACPSATGNEHFSVQHKIARENMMCKEQCEATRAQTAAACSATR